MNKKYHFQKENKQTFFKYSYNKKEVNGIKCGCNTLCRTNWKETKDKIQVTYQVL